MLLKKKFAKTNQDNAAVDLRVSQVRVAWSFYY